LTTTAAQCDDYGDVTITLWPGQQAEGSPLTHDASAASSVVEQGDTHVTTTMSAVAKDRRTVSEYRLISADSHLTEPGDLWTSRVAAKYRDRVPHIVHLPEGAAWVMEGVPKPIAFGFTVCAGNRPEDMRDWMPIEEMRSGGWDPAKRLDELDIDRVDAEVLYPNRPWQSVVANTDAEFHLVMVKAYNDWLSEYCSYAPARLGGMAAIPNRGVEAAVAEVERTATMPGFVGYNLSCYPHGDTTLDPADDPVWAAIEATGKPIAIHVALTNAMPFQFDARKLPGTAHFHDAPNRMLELIFGGVLDRYPGLRFVMTEVDCGWVPYFADQADDNYLRHEMATLKDRKLPKLPGDYMRENFYFTFITDMYGIENRHRIGVEHMLWSNDYPHIVSDWPYSWRSINAQFANVPQEERHAILAGNALKLFRFGSA
jgi:predicted TIM-barrel fold metal-dependent hydrolase